MEHLGYIIFFYVGPFVFAEVIKKMFLVDEAELCQTICSAMALGNKTAISTLIVL